MFETIAHVLTILTWKVERLPTYHKGVIKVVSLLCVCVFFSYSYFFVRFFWYIPFSPDLLDRFLRLRYQKIGHCQLKACGLAHLQMVQKEWHCLSLLFISRGALKCSPTFLRVFFFIALDSQFMSIQLSWWFDFTNFGAPSGDRTRDLALMSHKRYHCTRREPS
jgi:hypothetical protein